MEGLTDEPGRGAKEVLRVPVHVTAASTLVPSVTSSWLSTTTYGALVLLAFLAFVRRSEASSENSGAGSSIPLLIRSFRAGSILDAFERLLWWLFAGSAGAKTRGQVICAIKEEPRNAQQLSEALHLDYSTVRHHLRVLEQNRLVVTEGGSYGKLYFVSDSMEAHWGKLQAMLGEARTRRGP